MYVAGTAASYAFTSTDSSPVLSSAALRLVRGEHLPGASLSPTLRPAGCPRSWRTGGQDVPHLVRGRGRRRAPFAPRCAPATGSPVGLSSTLSNYRNLSHN